MAFESQAEFRLGSAVLAAALAAMLGGCGNGHGATLPPAPPAKPGPQTMSVTFRILIPQPAASARARRPAYVSASTKSASIAVSPGTTPPVVVNCTTICSGQIAAPVGNDTFTVALFDQPNGAGHTLSTGSTTQQILLDHANAVGVTFDGVVASIAVSLAPGSVTRGTPATVAVTVSGLDADGNTIVGPGTYVDANGNALIITLADSDTSGATTLSQTKVTAPSTPVTLSYNGSAIASATITASATGTASKTATLTVTTTTTLHLYVASADGNAINVYAAGASGNIAPVRVIAGPATHLSFPVALAFDAAGDLLVAESTSGNAEVDAFAPNASGNVAPLYTLVPSPGGGAAQGLAIDPHGALSESFCGTCFFTGADGVATYTLTPPGGTETRSLGGSGTGLNAPYGIAYDPTGNLYVANDGSNSIALFAPGVSGNVAPSRTISTGIAAPSGIALDAANDIFVSDATTTTMGSIPVYAPGTSSPARTLSNAVSDVFSGAPGIAADAAGDVFVPSGPPCGTSAGLPCAARNAIVVYPAASGTPSRVIAGAATGLNDPDHVVLDGAGSVYALDDPQSGAFVTVYPTSTNGNVAPARTVQLPHGSGGTSITTAGIAAAANGTLYAVDATSSIGTATTALDVFGPTSTGPPATRSVAPPTATATFQIPLGVDTAQNVYVLGLDTGQFEVFVYAPGATSLLRTLTISAFSNISGGAVAADGTLYVTSIDKGIAIYGPGASGSAAPTRTILVSPPSQLAKAAFAVDGAATMYASADNAVWVYPSNAGGSTPPSRQILGASAGLNGNLGLTFDAAGNLYVANRYNHSVTVFAPNAARPMQTLSGPATLLVGPGAVAIGP